MKRTSLALLGLAGICFAAPQFFPEGPSDASAFRELLVTPEPVEGPEHMYDPALEGGPTGKIEDSTLANLRQNAGADGVPSGAPPSPLFGAGSWEQKLLRFEEFGTTPVEVGSADQPGLPLPADLRSTVDGAELDDLLLAPLWPAPTLQSNTQDVNPWSPMISQYLGREVTSPAEGRPPGEGWAHQRYDEFTPVEMFTTVQTGARVNTGFRDGLQRHGYQHTAAGFSEFGPGGLYHATCGDVNGDIPGTEGTTAGIDVRFHPAMPAQLPESLWTFDGVIPPRLLTARVGVPVMMRHYNALPIDVTANRGFGMHTISTHEHNGHNPAESDGFAGSFYFPGQYWDYRWPMAIAGHDSINVAKRTGLRRDLALEPRSIRSSRV
jgi:hypothetical protein